MTLDITYGSTEGPVYLNIKSNEQAQRIFNKFIDSILGNDREMPNETLYQLLKEELLQYNAVYRFNQAKSGHIRKQFIRFATAKDLTAFLMRYS